MTVMMKDVSVSGCSDVDVAVVRCVPKVAVHVLVMSPKTCVCMRMRFVRVRFGISTDRRPCMFSGMRRRPVYGHVRCVHVWVFIYSIYKEHRQGGVFSGTHIASMHINATTNSSHISHACIP